jgi:hypothetical protein
VVAVGDGDKHQTFLVQENLLCARSKALKSRLSETTVESGLKTVSLNELDPEAFALYFQFLYSGRIPSKPVYPSPDEHTLLAKLYVLTCSLEDVPAQNAALDVIHAKSQELVSIFVPALPRSEGVRVVYHGTKGACGARRLMVDMFLSMGSGVLMRPLKDVFPPEFMVELALSLMGSLRSKRGYIVKPKEQYHGPWRRRTPCPRPCSSLRRQSRSRHLERYVSVAVVYMMWHGHGSRLSIGVLSFSNGVYGVDLVLHA